MDTILTITGSDNTGGSGVQADIRAITELGGRMVSVVTCITIQNTLGIQEFYDIPAQVVADQIEAIGNDMQPPHRQGWNGAQSPDLIGHHQLPPPIQAFIRYL